MIERPHRPSNIRRSRGTTTKATEPNVHALALPPRAVVSKGRKGARRDVCQLEREHHSGLRPASLPHPIGIQNGRSADARGFPAFDSRRDSCRSNARTRSARIPGVRCRSGGGRAAGDLRGPLLARAAQIASVQSCRPPRPVPPRRSHRSALRRRDLRALLGQRPNEFAAAAVSSVSCRATASIPAIS
jgi:hypothetical protein